MIQKINVDDYSDISHFPIRGNHEQNHDVGTFVETENETVDEKEEDNVIKNPSNLSVGDKFSIF